MLVVAWLASSLAYAGLQPDTSRLLTGDRFLDLALQGSVQLFFVLTECFSVKPLLLVAGCFSVKLFFLLVLDDYSLFKGGLAIATALLTGLLAAGFGRRYFA